MQLRKRDERYYQSSWAFQRFFVRLFLVPLPFCVAFIGYWRFEGFARLPLLWWAIVLGSFGATLGFAFLFWRCPACNSILFRTSESGAGILFWLSDPETCPDCGIPLKQKNQ